MARLSHTKRIATVFAATSAQAGFPANNLANNSLARPWYATTTGANDFTITFPAAIFVASWTLYDVNFATATIKRSADGAAFVDVGPATTYTDENGRARSDTAIGGADVKALRFSIANGASLDGLGFWRCGAQYPWGGEIALPVGVSYGYKVNTLTPQVAAELLNGLVATAGTGVNVDRIELPFDRKYDKSLTDLIRRTRAAPCLFKTENANYPWQMWPVRLRERNVEESYYKVQKAQRVITLTEVVSAN